MNPFNKNQNGQGKKLSNQVGNIARQASNKLTEIKDSVSSATGNMANSIKEKVANVQKKATNVTDKPDISKLGAMTQEFFSANTAISHFVTFMLCLLLFIIILQVGSKYIMYFFGPHHNPYIINGMVDSNIQKVITANPNLRDSVPIYRSIDQPQGVEFSWNVWFFVNDSNVIKEENALIFSKGKNKLNQPFLGVSPGLYLSKPTANTQKLTVAINTFDNSNNNIMPYETIVIPDIPMKKWVCCTIRAQGTYIDVYINGVLTQRKILQNLPQQNYGDTYIGDAGGFKGYVSSLRYYSKAISYEEIQTLFASGPSLIMLGGEEMPTTNDYLSMNWFYKYTSLN